MRGVWTFEIQADAEIWAWSINQTVLTRTTGQLDDWHQNLVTLWMKGFFSTGSNSMAFSAKFEEEGIYCNAMMGLLWTVISLGREKI